MARVAYAPLRFTSIEVPPVSRRSKTKLATNIGLPARGLRVGGLFNGSKAQRSEP